MTSRANRRNDGSTPMFTSDLRQLTARHLPETIGQIRSGDRWSTTRMRPEVANVIDCLAQRHVEGTGREITKSEIIAAALNLSLPFWPPACSPRRAPIDGPGRDTSG